MSELTANPFWQQLQNYPLITLEIELVLILFLAFIRFGAPDEWRALKFFAAVARNEWKAVAITALVAAIAHLCAVPVLRAPQPGLHDEFSYLLAGQTFAMGRLANPTHPLWKFFESFHIEHVPTYASMYPPAQGFVLALGFLLGNPAIGVWLSAVVFSASVTWMLRPWVPPIWALIGGLLAVARVGIYSYWANTYWGGAVPAIGACLAWGAFGRLRREFSALYAAVMGVGILLLANSRPYEGCWVSLPLGGAILWWWLAKRYPPSVITRRVIIPLAAVLLCGAFAMAYYNWRVFGSPFTLPYTVNRAQYSIAPSFIWGTAAAPRPYNHPVMQKFYTEIETSGYQASPTLMNYLRLTRLKIATFWLFFIGPALTLPLIFSMIAVWRGSARLRWPAAGLAALSLGIAVLVWPTNPHYYSPATACIYILIIDGLRRLYTWRRRTGLPARAMVSAVVITCVAVLGVRATANTFGVADVNSVTPVPWYSAETFPLELRTRAITALRSLRGKHLVIVRYSASHLPFQEFVYNDADIDGSQIVWARELPDRSASKALIQYYPDRSAWLYRPDERPYELVSYSEEPNDPEPASERVLPIGGPGDTVALTAPKPGSVLPSALGVFSWTHDQDVTLYSFSVGSGLDQGDINTSRTPKTSVLVTNLPTDGRTIFVSLAPQVAGIWRARKRYTFMASGVDFAAHKLASQSSTCFGATADKAADGIVSGDFGGNSVTHTCLNANPWWEVDLGDSRPIHEIVIWNRTDCCLDRLKGYWVFVSESPFQPQDTPAYLQRLAGVWSHYEAKAPPQKIEISVGKLRGQFVRVQLSEAGYLSLAEVQVR